MKNPAIIIISLTVFALVSWLLPTTNVHGEEQQDVESKTTEEPGMMMSLLDSSHAYILDLANGPAVWFDSFFDDPLTEEEEEAPTTTLRLKVASLLTEGEGLTFPIRLRASFVLPRASRKLRLIVVGARDNELSTVQNEESTSVITGSDETEEKSRVGLRYSLYKTLRSKLHFGGGLRISSPFEYYGRIRYRRIIHIGRQNIVRFSETGYWNSIDGYGETSRLDLDRLITETVTSRLSLSITYSEISRGVDWGVGTSLFKKFSAKTAASLDLSANGVTRPDTEILNYRIACRLRKNILRPWLYLEVVPEVTFPLDELTGERDAVGAILLAMEAQFVAK